MLDWKWTRAFPGTNWVDFWWSGKYTDKTVLSWDSSSLWKIPERIAAWEAQFDTALWNPATNPGLDTITILAKCRKCYLWDATRRTFDSWKLWAPGILSFIDFARASLRIKLAREGIWHSQTRNWNEGIKFKIDWQTYYLKHSKTNSPRNPAGNSCQIAWSLTYFLWCREWYISHCRNREPISGQSKVPIL